MQTSQTTIESEIFIPKTTQLRCLLRLTQKANRHDICDKLSSVSSHSAVWAWMHVLDDSGQLHSSPYSIHLVTYGKEWRLQEINILFKNLYKKDQSPKSKTGNTHEVIYQKWNKKNKNKQPVNKYTEDILKLTSHSSRIKIAPTEKEMVISNIFHLLER